MNYFGISEPHGPLAISMQREKTEAGADRGETNYQYRIIIRSVQVGGLNRLRMTGSASRVLDQLISPPLDENKVCGQ